MYRSFVGSFLIFTCVATAAAQNASPQDTLVAGTPEFEAIQLKVKGQERIRVTTRWGRALLLAPQLSGQGMDFGSVRFEGRPPRGASGFRRPLPLSSISQIEVRVGSPWAGALLGAGAGVALTTGAYALCDEGCESGTDTKLAIHASVTTVTTLVGAMIGRGGWGWSPVYRAKATRGADLSVSGYEVRFTLRLPPPGRRGY